MKNEKKKFNRKGLQCLARKSVPGKKKERR